VICQGVDFLDGFTRLMMLPDGVSAIDPTSGSNPARVTLRDIARFWRALAVSLGYAKEPAAT
jgi:hypothetical protein